MKSKTTQNFWQSTGKVIIHHEGFVQALFLYFRQCSNVCYGLSECKENLSCWFQFSLYIEICIEHISSIKSYVKWCQESLKNLSAMVLNMVSRKCQWKSIHLSGTTALSLGKQHGICVSQKYFFQQDIVSRFVWNNSVLNIFISLQFYLLPSFLSETMVNWSRFVQEEMMPHMIYFYIDPWLSSFVLKLEQNLGRKFSADQRESTAATVGILIPDFDMSLQK